jgi:hypothetical protein
VCALSLLLLVASGAAPAAAAPSPAPASTAPDACVAVDAGTPLQLYRDGAYLTAHHLALTLRTVCGPRAPASPRWGLISALSLAKLDDAAGAARLLRELAAAAGDADPTARVALAWLYLTGEDRQAFEAVAASLPAAPAARLQALAAAGTPAPAPAELAGRLGRLPDPLAAAARREHDALAAALRDRRPWLAGTLSAVLPGAGQIYAGSWQSAAVAFALNAVWLTATVELMRHRLYFTGSAAALVTSVFYVGSIANAADLARRHNQSLAREPRTRLERLLVPEVFP